MDIDAVIDRVLARGETKSYPVISTSREEIAETCRELGLDDLLEKVETASDEQIAEVAQEMGEELIQRVAQSGDEGYWAIIPEAAERVLS